MPTDLERTIYTCETLAGRERASCSVLRECQLAMVDAANRRSTPRGHAEAARRVAKELRWSLAVKCDARQKGVGRLGACPCKGLQGTKRRKATKRRR